jgi:hypothetical protein
VGNYGNAQVADPSGNVASAAANGLLVTTASGTPGIKSETGAQLHTLNPGAGLWTVIVDFYTSVSGTAVTQPFTVTVNDTPVTAAAQGLPDSASTTLAAGTPVTALVTVHNDGTAPEAYFVDARLGHHDVRAARSAGVLFALERTLTPRLVIVTNTHER